MKLALAQINPTVGDIEGNVELIRRFVARAASAGVRLVIFPELSVIGYPPRDLLMKPRFVADQVDAVRQLARESGDTAMLVGYARPNPGAEGRPLQNCIALLQRGRIEAVVAKSSLPTYDVFDESRYFEPAESSPLIELDGVRFGVSICEDLWNDERLISRRLYHRNPIADQARAGADIFVNCSASPFGMGKHEFRLKLFADQTRQHRIPLLYVNQVGGNDDLVFDGNSCLLDSGGRIVAHARDFEQDLLVVDMEDLPARTERPKVGVEALYSALVLGLRDYARKCGFRSVVLGLSGGVDSAVSAAIAADAVGAENVLAVAMPSRYSSRGSLDDAAALARNLGIRLLVVPIEPAHRAMEQMLSEAFAGTEPDTTEENIQARIRGNIVMALSNKFGHLPISTGNKSELAVGYCTLYGDMSGGLGVIGDVLKTSVYELAHFINRRRPLIPDSILTKPPSAELRPNQTDQDSLPAYEVLDTILQMYIEQEKSADEIIEATSSREGFSAELVRSVIVMVDRNEYKRRQAAPVLKVSSRAFGYGRRMPIAQRYNQFRNSRS